MERLADLSRREKLPIYTHIYENKGMALAARQHHKAHDGSLVKYMESTGMAGPLVSLAHTIWIREDEIQRMAETGTNVVLCPASNMKSKSGVAPMRLFVKHGVNVAIGTDNCACSDTQNVFHSMKLFVGLAAVSELEPGPPYASDAIRAATEGSARTAGLEGQLGALKAGRKADLVILDMSDSSYLPLNSAARQVVFSEAGRAVETVIVDGKVVVQDRRLVTIDEAALHEAVASIMPTVRRDREVVSARVKQFLPHVLEADRRVWAHDVGIHRYIGGHSH
jgi:cytosine/adenosine deaminase-related metal-dependent hydrolase